jgi:hypothetical protein
MKKGASISRCDSIGLFRPFYQARLGECACRAEQNGRTPVYPVNSNSGPAALCLSTGYGCPKRTSTARTNGVRSEIARKPIISVQDEHARRGNVDDADADSAGREMGSIKHHLSINDQRQRLPRFARRVRERDHLSQEKTGNLPSPLPAVERQLDFSPVHWDFGVPITLSSTGLAQAAC